MDNIDESLWRNFRNGDNDAYISIYRKYVQSLFYQGLQFTRDKEMINDCIQEVFVKIYKYRSNLSDTTNIKYYLLSAMRNQLITALAKEKAHADIPTDELPPIQTELRNIEEELMEREEEELTVKQVDNLLSLLTPRQREAVRYRYIECLETDEICSLMGLNIQSLHNILFRSMKKIRLHFKIHSKNE